MVARNVVEYSYLQYRSDLSSILSAAKLFLLFLQQATDRFSTPGQCLPLKEAFLFVVGGERGIQAGRAVRGMTRSALAWIEAQFHFFRSLSIISFSRRNLAYKYTIPDTHSALRQCASLSCETQALDDPVPP